MPEDTSLDCATQGHPGNARPQRRRGSPVKRNESPPIVLWCDSWLARSGQLSCTYISAGDENGKPTTHYRRPSSHNPQTQQKITANDRELWLEMDVAGGDCTARAQPSLSVTTRPCRGPIEGLRHAGMLEQPQFCS